VVIRNHYFYRHWLTIATLAFPVGSVRPPAAFAPASRYELYSINIFDSTGWPADF